MHVRRRDTRIAKIAGIMRIVETRRVVKIRRTTGMTGTAGLTGAGTGAGMDRMRARRRIRKIAMEEEGHFERQHIHGAL